jgi:hypothetical protein
MEIELLHFDGCTNTGEAMRRLQGALEANDVQAAIRLVEVHDFEEALAMRFLGSPTIRIDGEDIEPDARLRTEYGFMSRVYRADDESIAFVPSLTLIAQAVRSRAQGQNGTSSAARVARHVLAGAAAALLATYVMDGVGDAISARTDDAVKAQEKAVQPKPALSLLAERILRARGQDASDEAAVRRLGDALHWAYGAANGALYGLLDATVPMFHRSRGAPLIVGLICFDEFGLAALGLAQPPRRYPAATHVRAVVNHLAYWAVLVVATRGLVPDRNNG